MSLAIRTGVLLSILALGVGVAACGGDDDDTGDSSVADPGDNGGELAFGDICELVPATVVEEVMGSPVTTAPLGVGDGLPGAGCTYTGTGVLLSISVVPEGAGFYEATKSAAGADAVELDGLGDKAFVYLDSEVQAVSGDTLVQVQFPSGGGASEQGVELVRRSLDALP